jgi:hypothetical protein
MMLPFSVLESMNEIVLPQYAAIELPHKKKKEPEAIHLVPCHSANGTHYSTGYSSKNRLSFCIN